MMRTRPRRAPAGEEPFPRRAGWMGTIIRKEEAIADETTRRTGSDTSQPHGDQGPPTDRNKDLPRGDSDSKYNVQRDAEGAHNPTNPAKVRPETKSGRPG